MLSWSTRRKLVHSIALGIFLVFLISPVVLYFFSEKETCSDGSKNGNEKGIDCGGSCPRACSFEATLPVVLWVRPLKITDSVWGAVAFVSNQNPTLSGEARYILRIFDDKGLLLSERKGTAFLPAGESVPIYEGAIVVGNLLPAKASLSFEGDLVWMRGEEERRLKTGKIEWSREEKSSFVSVEVENLENNSPRENIEVIVLVSDADGNVFASSRTFLEGIEKRSSEKASFTWPFSFPKEPSRIEAFAFERK
ncbi:MAG: hypothetical protein AAB545_00705 [Patescibacteria group bacterium]